MSKCGPKPIPAVERFWSKVEKTDTCWLWKAVPGSPRFRRCSMIHGPSHVRSFRVPQEIR